MEGHATSTNIVVQLSPNMQNTLKQDHYFLMSYEYTVQQFVLFHYVYSEHPVALSAIHPIPNQNIEQRWEHF